MQYDAPRILYYDGNQVYDTPLSTTVGSVLDGENHVLIGLILGGILYAIAYHYKRYDVCAILFFALAAGIAVDFYVNSYYH